VDTRIGMVVWVVVEVFTVDVDHFGVVIEDLTDFVDVFAVVVGAQVTWRTSDRRVRPARAT